MARKQRYNQRVLVGSEAPSPVGASRNDCGLREANVLLGVGTPGGGASAYSVIVLLTFNPAADLNQAVAPHGAAIIGDIANLRSVQPIIQLNDIIA